MRLSDITPQYLLDNYILGAELQRAIRLNDFIQYENSIKNDIERLIKQKSESFLAAHIKNSADEMEGRLGVYLSPKTIVTRPEIEGLTQGEDYDIAGTPMTYYYRDWMHFNRMETPFNNIRKINRLRMVHGDHVVGEIPLDWIVINAAKEGILSIVPWSGGLFIQGAAQLGFGIMYYLNRDRVPGFWNLDLESGLDELPGDIVRYICVGAARDILAILSNTLSGGIASKSISFDGFSSSIGTTASAIYSLYSALENSYKEILKTDFSHMKHEHRGLKVFRI